MKPKRIKWIALASVALFASACKTQNVADTPVPLPADETAAAQTDALPEEPPAPEPEAATAAEAERESEAALQAAPAPSAPAPEAPKPATSLPYHDGNPPPPLTLPAPVAETAPAPSYAGPEIDPELFDKELAPFGQWTQIPRYGRVWVPATRIVGSHFRPYVTHGHWAYCDGAWTWVSDFKWGWAPFHYGRWVYTKQHGWAWIPGRRWATAWVAWRHGRGHIGWAPLAPEVQELTPAYIERYIPRTAWVLVPANRLLDRRVHAYVIPSSRHRTVLVQTTVINRTSYISGAPIVVGPSRTVIETYVRRRIEERPVTTVRTHVLPPRTVIVAAQARRPATPVRPPRSLALSTVVNVNVNIGARPAARAARVSEAAPKRVAPVTRVVVERPAPAVRANVKAPAPAVRVTVRTPAPAPREIAPKPAPKAKLVAPAIRVKAAAPVLKAKIAAAPALKVKAAAPALKAKIAAAPALKVKAAAPALKAKIAPAPAIKVKAAAPALKAKIAPAPAIKVKAAAPALKAKIAIKAQASAPASKAKRPARH